LYSAIDLIFILLAVIIAFFCGYLILLFFRLKQFYCFSVMVLTNFGHLIGMILFWVCFLYIGSDSFTYFNKASNAYGFHQSTILILWIVYWLRQLIFGDSYLGVTSFFMLFGFLGSLLYFVIFCELLKVIENKRANLWTKQKQWYGLLVACWPSSLFWLSSIGKDALCYFFIALFFLSLIKIKRHVGYIIFLIFSAIGAYLVRPYLFLIAGFAFVFWLIFSSNRRLNLLQKGILCFILAYLFISLSYDISQFGSFSYNFDSIIDRATLQQSYLSSGTHIQMSPSRHILFVFFLPIAMLENLVFPLFFGVHNFIGLVASIENLALVFFLLNFLKHLPYWKELKKQIPIFSYMFWFFIVGIGFLGMINTNLGLASRQKLMYLPLFLIAIFLTFIFRKTTHNNSNFSD